MPACYVPVCLKKKHNARKAVWFTKATVHWSNFCIFVDSIDSQIMSKMEPPIIKAKKWGVYSTVLPVTTSFYFMNQNYFIMVFSVQKYSPSTLNNTSSHENGPFLDQISYNFDLP